MEEVQSREEDRESISPTAGPAPINPSSASEESNSSDDERGGQITIFTKNECPYCVRLKTTLQKCVDKVLQENPKGMITWKEVDCTGSNASLCVRLTGSFSVPHVFFNREYIGDSSKTCASAQVTDDDKNMILKKLKDIALGPKLDPPFPPPPDAIMTKITDELACSGQPTEDQLSKLGSSFGFKSVVNLSSPLESSFYKGEGDLLQKASAELEYVHLPLVNLTPETISAAMDKVKNSSKPVLIHCDTGQRSLLVALLLATEAEEEVDEASFVSWGSELGVNLSKLAMHAISTREWRKANKSEGGQTAAKPVEHDDRDTESARCPGAPTNSPSKRPRVSPK